MKNISRHASEAVIQKYKLISGKHVYGNLYDIKNNELLPDLEKMSALLKEAIELGGMHIIEMVQHKFSPDLGGISIIALLKESHATIHTWPEGNYATIDIYSCGEKTDPEKAFDYLTKKLEPGRCKRSCIDRSI